MIKVGQKYLCIKDVVMKGSRNEIAYIKGKIYRSEINNCLTDEDCSKDHYWTNDNSLKEYFIRIPRNKKYSIKE